MGCSEKLGKDIWWGGNTLTEYTYSASQKTKNKMAKETYELYGGKVILEFDPQSHIYSANGKQVWGVTNITGVLNKPALLYWGVNQAVDFMANNLKPGVALDEIQIKNLLESARIAHTQTKNQAADIGTFIHNWVRDYVSAVAQKKTSPKRPINKEMKNAIDGFFKWAKENKLVIARSERKVYHDKFRYAGTLDLEGMVNGKRTVIDLKTGNALYPEAFLQASAYLKAREQETGKQYPGGIVIVRLSKENPEKHIAAFEARRDEDVDLHFKCFLNCLSIYRWQQAMRKQQLINKINGN